MGATDPEAIAPEVQPHHDETDDQLNDQPNDQLNDQQIGHATDDEKAVGGTQAYVPQNDEDYEVTFKTWIVVGILAWSYGISFWIVPSLSACQAVVASQLGDVTAQAFYISIYTMTVTIAFMVCGGE